LIEGSQNRVVVLERNGLSVEGMQESEGGYRTKGGLENALMSRYFISGTIII
jgi:hypothetical protein